MRIGAWRSSVEVLSVRAMLWPVVACLFFIQTGARADEKIVLELPVTLDPDADIDRDVRQKCDIQAIVGQQVLEKVRQSNPSTIPTEQLRNDASRFMRIRIVRSKKTSVVEIRRLSVSMEVVKDNKVVWDRYIRGTTTFAVREGMDLCSLMDQVASSVGTQVGKWSGRAWRETEYVGAAAASPGRAVAPSNQRSAEADSPSVRRLKELQLLLDRGLIAPEEYQEKRKAILKEL